MHRKNDLTVLLLMLLMLLMLPGCSMLKPKKAEDLTPAERAKIVDILSSTKPPAEIDVNALPLLQAAEIRQLYDENPLNSRSRYDGQWLKVTGTVLSGPEKVVVKELTAYALGLGRDKQFVSCVFTGIDKEAQLSTLKNGQQLTVVGRYIQQVQGPGLVFCFIFEEK